MRKRDKLYTANKWNRPLFADVDRENQNIFDGEFNSSMQIDPLQKPSGIPITTGYNPQVNIPDKININGIIQQNAYNDYMNSSDNNWFGISKKNNPFSKQNVGTTMKGIGASAAVAAGAVNTGDPRGLYDTLDPVYHLAGGRESDVGNGLSNAGVGLFNAGAQSGNGWLMLAGAGAKILGGLTNAAWGLKENKENVSALKDSTANKTAVGNTTGNISTISDIINLAGYATGANDYSTGDLYKGGWFSKNKARRKGQKLIDADDQALAYQNYNLISGINRIDRMNDDITLNNTFAFGGPLGAPIFGNTGMGAIDYGFMSDYLTAKNKQAENKNTASNPFAGVANNFFSDGGGIHIKKSHEGLFTEKANRAGMGVQEYASHVLANKENYPTSTVRQANFARNAKKFKHAYGGFLGDPKNIFDFGGDMQTNSADFSTGLTYISAGGSHSENPYDGVQLGVDSEGKPNLVEEGEVIFNDYVFSDRIPIDDETKKKFHFPKKRDITYAEAAKKLEKEISERPADPISKASFNAQMRQLEEQQERQKQEMEAARAREAFEALSPEEQAGVMRYAQQQEQAAQEQAMQQETMAQQAQMQQPSPEEIAMAEQQQMMPQEEMAYGGNLFAVGGAMDYLKNKYPQMSVDSLRKMATILEKKVTESLTDKRSKQLTREATNKDYDRAFAEYDSLNSNRRFNNWVKAGLSRDVAFDISYAKPPKSWGQGELDKWNAKRAELTKEPERRTVYKNPLNGKTFNTKAEADADVKAYKEAQRQQAASSKASKPAHQTFEDSRGWKHSTQEAAEAANARYAKQNQQNSTGSYVDDRGWKHSTQQAAEAANKRYAQQAQSAQSSGQAPQKDIAKDSATNTASKSAQSVASSQRAASRQSSKNMGVWKEGVSNQWDTYTRPGLDAYLSDLEERYNNAASEEEREAIRSAAINEFNNLQQSYYDYVLPGIGNTPTGYDENVEAHQRMFENMKGNTGFWGIGNDGSITNRIENDIDMPTGHHTTDTPAGHGIDGYNGPRTSIRNFGSTEYGGDDYYAPYVERFNNLGLTYSPMQKWRYGDDLGKSLYGLSMGEEYPEDATNFGDYNPDYEEEDTFEVVDENGNPTGISASSEEAATGVPGTAAVANNNPVPRHKAEWMRYAGLFGPAVGLGMQMAGIGKPDYSGLDAAVNGSGNAYLANWAPIGNYLRYEPMDIWFEQNRLNANARATDRAILNSGSNQGAKAAALLASGYNTQTASGDLYRKGLEYNDALRQQVAGFNRGTDQFNAEAYNRTALQNAETLNRQRQYRAQLGMQAAAQKADLDAGWYNGIYGNVAGLFKGIGDIGRENAQHNMIAEMAADGIFGSMSPRTNTGRRGKYLTFTKKACGGKLNKKKGGK